MANEGKSNQELERARERIADILRTAMGGTEEESIEDETRRLMLQLSIEPPPAPTRTLASPQPKPKRRLLGRLLRKPHRRTTA